MRFRFEEREKKKEAKMAAIFEAISTAKDFLSKLLNTSTAQIEITKVARVEDGWEVEALSEESGGRKRNYSIAVDDNREVQSYYVL